MSKTPTVHNPTHFEPSDYEVTNYLDNQRPKYFGQGLNTYNHEVSNWEAEMAFTLGADWRKKAGHCIHCGNGRVRWITATLHVPTGETVVFGSDCTARLGFSDKFAFKLAQLQQKAATRKVKFAIWNKREKFLAANPTFAAAILTLDEPVHAKNSFARDVVSKLNQYGNLSERQVAAVVSSLARDEQFAVKAVAEALEVKGLAPEGRQTVTGTVLSTKMQDGFYGQVRKMLVKLDNGSKVWMTAPATVQRDGIVTVTATFEVSKDDKSFAFGSRPSLVKFEAAAV